MQPAPPISQGTTTTSLLTAADPLPPQVADYAAWRTGLTWRSPVDVLGETHPHDCNAMSWGERNDPAIPEVEPFTIGTVHGCSGKVNEAEVLAEATDALLSKQAWLIAREFWMGTNHTISMQAEASTVSGTGGPLDVIDFLVQNHQDATKGGRTIVHVPRQILGVIADNVDLVGNQLRLKDGTVVVAGPGYPTGSGTFGPDGASQTASEQWIYVTGPVEVGLSEVTITDAGNGVASRQNLVEVYVQRQAIVRFDPTFTFAGKATLS